MTKRAMQDLKLAQETAQRIVREAGLTVLHGEEPTDSQVRLAALHAREDAAYVATMQGLTLARLDRITWWLRAICAVVVLNLLTTCAHAAPRSSTAVRQFKAQQPCPATGAASGPCPGWQVDHREALVCGGVDAVENLQWLTVEEHKAKTRVEVKLCRSRLR
jgi:hypothetical protein